MSIHSSVRLRLLAAAPAVGGLLAFALVINDLPVQADGNNSRPTIKKVVLQEPISYPTVRKTSTELPGGVQKTVKAGVNGVKKTVYAVTYVEDEELSRSVLETKILKKPVTEIVSIGTVNRGKLPSRGYFSGRKSFRMSATGYDPSPASNGGNRTGRSAIGLKIGHGIVAVDPKFIPLGTKLYVEGYGYAVAADVGGAIKGNRIDLGYDTRSAAMRVGRRTVTVHILD